MPTILLPDRGPDDPWGLQSSGRASQPKGRRGKEREENPLSCPEDLEISWSKSRNFDIHGYSLKESLPFYCLLGYCIAALLWESRNRRLATCLNTLQDLASLVFIADSVNKVDRQSEERDGQTDHLHRRIPVDDEGWHANQV